MWFLTVATYKVNSHGILLFFTYGKHISSTLLRSMIDFFLFIFVDGNKNHNNKDDEKRDIEEFINKDEIIDRSIQTRWL